MPNELIFDPAQIADAVARARTVKQALVNMNKQMTYKEFSRVIGLFGGNNNEWGSDDNERLTFVMETLYEVEHRSGVYDRSTYARITRETGTSAWSWLDRPGKRWQWNDPARLWPAAKAMQSA
jgi:hypothetical protein